MTTDVRALDENDSGWIEFSYAFLLSWIGRLTVAFIFSIDTQNCLERYSWATLIFKHTMVYTMLIMFSHWK